MKRLTRRIVAPLLEGSIPSTPTNFMISSPDISDDVFHTASFAVDNRAAAFAFFVSVGFAGAVVGADRVPKSSFRSRMCRRADRLKISAFAFRRAGRLCAGDIGYDRRIYCDMRHS